MWIFPLPWVVLVCFPPCSKLSSGQSEAGSSSHERICQSPFQRWTCWVVESIQIVIVFYGWSEEAAIEKSYTHCSDMILDVIFLIRPMIAVIFWAANQSSSATNNPPGRVILGNHCWLLGNILLWHQDNNQGWQLTFENHLCIMEFPTMKLSQTENRF